MLRILITQKDVWGFLSVCVLLKFICQKIELPGAQGFLQSLSERMMGVEEESLLSSLEVACANF